MKHSIPKSYYKSNSRDVKLSRGKTIAVFSDIHAPYHDVASLNEAVNRAKKASPDVVILLGDIMDFHRISRYPNDPGTLSFADEIRVGVELLEYMRRSFPNAEFHYIEGNHEVRLAHYIQRNAAELQGLNSLDLAFLLELDRFEIGFLQMGFIHCGDMTFLHGHEIPGIGGVNPSRKLFTKMKKSAMCGHLHRPESFYTRDGAGKMLQCHVVGHLGDPHPAYWMRNEWQHGYAMVDVSKGGVVRVDNVIL